LSAAEAERAWAHVHACHFCRDLVEREGWIKTRLAGLSLERDGTPDSLKGSLAHGSFLGASASVHPAHRSRSSVAFLGGTAVGAAVAGVLALGVAQAGAPAERRPPVTSLARPTTSPSALLSPSTVSARSVSALQLSTLRAQAGIAGVKIVP
ncbi:MAG: hypothetical protein ACR2JD_08925, partial [Nocardioides sp.]